MQALLRDRCLYLSLSLALLGCRPELRTEGAVEYIADSRRVLSDRQQLALQIDQAELDLEIARAPKPELEHWNQLFSFVQVSDVQIRDSGIRYFSNSAMESAIDVFATSTKRHEKLDRNDEYPWAALVGGINRFLRDHDCERLPGAIPNGTCPRFLIHTGDAIDAGTVGELNRFLSISNRLRIPWYSVVGNHDIFLMGNFTESQISFINMPTESVPLVLNRGRFMRFHGPSRWNETLLHQPTAAGWFGMPASRFHGFDTVFPKMDLPDAERPLRPYYSLRFAASAPSSDPTRVTPKIRFIVLDTTEQHRMVKHVGKTEIPITGALGYIEPEQYEWFKQEITSAEEHGELILVAGHHPLLAPTDFGSKVEQLGDLRGTDPSGTRNIAIKTLFAEHRSMLAYFGGHTHLLRFASIPSSHAVEVTAPSLHELPQVGFLVSLYQQREGRKLGLLVQTIQGVPGRDDLLAERLRQSCEGALLDKKKKVPEAGPTCGVSTSRFFVLGEPPSDGKQCAVSSDPAAEPIYRPFTEVTEAIETDWSRFRGVTLRSLLPFLTQQLHCIKFWMSPEVAEQADFVIDPADLPHEKMSIPQLLDRLLPKIPPAGKRHDIKLSWRYLPEGGQFQIYGVAPPHEPQPVCQPNPDLKLLPLGALTKPTLRSLLADLQRKLPCVRFSMTVDVTDWVEQPIPATALPTAPQTLSQLLDRVLPAVLLNGKESDLRLGWRLFTDDREQYQLYVEQKPLPPKPPTPNQTPKN